LTRLIGHCDQQVRAIQEWLQQGKEILIKIQPDATVCICLFTADSLYMFRVSQNPSSGVLKTVTAASGTATSLQRGLIRPHLREVAVPIL